MNHKDTKRGQKKFFQVIRNNKYLNLATSNKDSNPWISNLFFGFDYESLTFYWGSPVCSRHSKNIRTNPKVAINIYNPSTFKEIDDPLFRDAIYIEAIAKQCSLKELPKALSEYSKLLFLKGLITDKKEALLLAKSYKDFFGKSPLRFYKAKVQKAWLLGAGTMHNGKFVDERVEIHLIQSN